MEQQDKQDPLDLPQEAGSLEPTSVTEDGGGEAVSEEEEPEASPAQAQDRSGDLSVAAQEPRSVVTVGVRLRPGWPISRYDAGQISVTDGEWVVVDTDHGVEVGQVAGRPLEIQITGGTALPRVRGLASTHEIELYYQNLDLEKKAREICQERVTSLGLAMKLVRVERFFDGSKVLFSYFANGRVDFRELVKDLVKALKIRVEMRQIGIRHEAKMLGGIGGCGRELCCASFLKNFDPISIKMAKTQNLPLNPAKISGLCGRLLCCLTYEYDTYLNLKRDMPTLGKPCDTPAGEGKVVRQNILRHTVTVEIASGGQVEFDAQELKKCRESTDTVDQVVVAEDVGSTQSPEKRRLQQEAEDHRPKSQKRRSSRRQRRNRKNAKSREGAATLPETEKQTQRKEKEYRQGKKKKGGKKARSRSTVTPAQKPDNAEK
jgi:cell fate regulator YaaT (PSP1 superfamily)